MKPITDAHVACADDPGLPLPLSLGVLCSIVLYYSRELYNHSLSLKCSREVNEVLLNQQSDAKIAIVLLNQQSLNQQMLIQQIVC